MWLAYLFDKDAFIATNFVLDPRILDFKVPGLRVPGLMFLRFGSWFSGPRVPSLSSWFTRVPDLGFRLWLCQGIEPVNTEGVHEHRKCWKSFSVSWLRLWTTDKSLFIECLIWFKKHFLRDISILKNLGNFENLLKSFTVAWPDLGTKNKISFNKNHFKKGKYGKT